LDGFADEVQIADSMGRLARKLQKKNLKEIIGRIDEKGWKCIKKVENL
jgi:hypothetical protein